MDPFAPRPTATQPPDPTNEVGPAQLTGKVKSIDITGYLMPCHPDRQPFFMQLPGDGDDLFLPLFTTKEALDKGWGPIGGTPPRIVQITDGFDFLGSIPENVPEGGPRIRVIVDIRIELRDGKPVSRFTEIPRGDSPLLAQMKATLD